MPAEYIHAENFYVGRSDAVATKPQLKRSCCRGSPCRHTCNATKVLKRESTPKPASSSTLVVTSSIGVGVETVGPIAGANANSAGPGDGGDAKEVVAAEKYWKNETPIRSPRPEYLTAVMGQHDG